MRESEGECSDEGECRDSEGERGTARKSVGTV